MITGKNLDKFHRWYNKSKINVGYPLFMQYSFEMQIGVYLAYYDSFGMDVSVEQVASTFDIMISDEKREVLYEVYNFHSRNEAYKEAFKKANDLVNTELLKTR
jgi:hypothetical protein